MAVKSFIILDPAVKTKQQQFNFASSLFLSLDRTLSAHNEPGTGLVFTKLLKTILRLLLSLGHVNYAKVTLKFMIIVVIRHTY